MKKIVIFSAGIVLTGILCFGAVYSGRPGKAEAESYSKEKVRSVMSMVKPSPVFAEVVKDTVLYESADLTAEIIGNVSAGETGEILQDRTYLWYEVSLSGGRKGWLECEFINIPDDPKTNKNRMSDEDVEIYADIMDFESDTDYFVWTDIDRQLTHVFKGGKNNWTLLKTFDCATGKNQSPTTRGLFKTGDKGLKFYSERLESGALYWVRFNGSYLFHSVSVDKDGKISDPVVGERRSSGCVRMEMDDIKWFYENVPANTSVYIN